MPLAFALFSLVCHVSRQSDQNTEISNDFSVFFIGYNIPVLVYFLPVLIYYTSSGIFQKKHLTFLPERV